MWHDIHAVVLGYRRLICNKIILISYSIYLCHSLLGHWCDCVGYSQWSWPVPVSPIEALIMIIIIMIIIVLGNLLLLLILLSLQPLMWDSLIMLLHILPFQCVIFNSMWELTILTVLSITERKARKINTSHISIVLKNDYQHNQIKLFWNHCINLKCQIIVDIFSFHPIIK